MNASLSVLLVAGWHFSVGSGICLHQRQLSEIWKAKGIQSCPIPALQGKSQTERNLGVERFWQETSSILSQECHSWLGSKGHIRFWKSVVCLWNSVTSVCFPPMTFLWLLSNVLLILGGDLMEKNDNKSLYWQNGRLAEIWAIWPWTSKLNSRVTWGLCKDSQTIQLNLEGGQGGGRLDHNPTTFWSCWNVEIFSRIYLSRSQVFFPSSFSGNMMLPPHSGSPWTTWVRDLL